MQAMASIPRERAEWVVWIDMDVILGDISFTFPLTKSQYAGKDFVVWGYTEAVAAGDTYNGAHIPKCFRLDKCHMLMPMSSHWHAAGQDRTTHTPVASLVERPKTAVLILTGVTTAVHFCWGPLTSTLAWLLQHYKCQEHLHTDW